MQIKSIKITTLLLGNVSYNIKQEWMTISQVYKWIHFGKVFVFDEHFCVKYCRRDVPEKSFAESFKIANEKIVGKELIFIWGGKTTNAHYFIQKLRTSANM